LKPSAKRRAVYWNTVSSSTVFHPMIQEEPLSIRIRKSPYAVVMRTPGDEFAHAAGLCLAEGIVDTPDDIADLRFCGGPDADIVTVTLTAARQKMIRSILKHEGGPGAWGMAGGGFVQRLRGVTERLPDTAFMDIRRAYRLLEDLADLQPLRRRTRAAHAAALFSVDGKPLCIAEDVGRHNALDKAVGKLFLAGTLGSTSLLVLSSRISFELVQKAARARIPIILAVSRPTTLALALAFDRNITVACRAKESGLYIFTGRQRLVE